MVELVQQLGQLGVVGLLSEPGEGLLDDEGVLLSVVVLLQPLGDEVGDGSLCIV